MITTYKKYNESITNLLKGKSDDDIRKKLDVLSNVDKLRTIIKYSLDDKYFPGNIEEIKTEMIKEIKKHYGENLTNYMILLKEVKVGSNFGHFIDEILPNGLKIGVYHLDDEEKISDYTLSYYKLDKFKLLEIFNLLDNTYHPEDELDIDDGEFT